MIEQNDQRNSAEIVAMIPARGGSKGIARKNIQMLGDKPLVAWTIAMARAAKHVSRVIVSTDDAEIADIAKEYGAEVPFLRTSDISGDRANVAHALAHVRNQLYENERYVPTHQIVLYPTHPFRKLSTIESLIEKLQLGYESVFTVRQIDFPNEKYFFEKNGLLHPCGGEEITPQVRSYGYFYGRSLDFSASRHYQHVLTDDVELIDIDTWEDLELAREVVQQNLFDFAS